MNTIIRAIEPPSTPQQDIALQKYRKYMWNGISPFLASIQTVPSFVIDTQWEGLQIIDLWWGKWEFCKLFKERMPKADIACIDISHTWETINNDWVRIIWDCLLNVQKYINPANQYILVTCMDTIHHLENPKEFFTILEKLPENTGLYIKDYIRPSDYKELEQKMSMLSACINIVCKKDIATAQHVTTLSRQSLLAALCKDEVIEYSNTTPWVTYKETNSSITYEITRNIRT